MDFTGLVTVGDVVAAAAREYGDKPALRMADGRSRTFREVAERSSRLGRALRAKGLSAGDRVAVLSRNRIESTTRRSIDNPRRRLSIVVLKAASTTMAAGVQSSSMAVNSRSHRRQLSGAGTTPATLENRTSTVEVLKLQQAGEKLARVSHHR